MAKKNDDEGDDEILFLELDDSPEHKTVLKVAKQFHKANAERKNLLSTSKEKVDGLMIKLLGLMHENKLVKFKHKGVIVECIDPKEKVIVKMDGEDDDDDTDAD